MSRTVRLGKIDRHDPTPKYLQAQEILVRAIRAGQFGPGTKLPSTREISALFDISLITAHKALERLVENGWLRREVGRGTYVREDVDLANGVRGQLFVGLLLDQHVNIDDYYHSTIINALRRESTIDNRRVEFFFHDRFDLRDKWKSDVCAICIHPPLEMQPAVERLAQRCPIVILGGTFPGAHVATVDCDNRTGARAAVQHLHQLGHRRFMVLSGPTNLSNARDRAEGAVDELTEQGITLSQRDLPVSTDSVVLDETTKAQIVQRLSEPERPTAIIAGGYYLALAAIQAVRQAGLSIPADVSVIGFDDPPSAPLLDPPLTTVRQPLVEMAARGYNLVREAVDGGLPKQLAIQLPTELVLRDSTAPAR
jgi:DNA-binding LacI/PurR family transcriptional regulator